MAKPAPCAYEVGNHHRHLIIPSIRGDDTGVDIWSAAQAVFEAVTKTSVGKRAIAGADSKLLEWLSDEAWELSGTYRHLPLPSHRSLICSTAPDRGLAQLFLASHQRSRPHHRTTHKSIE